MLSNAYQRADCIHEFNQLKIEWKSQNRKSKFNSNMKLQFDTRAGIEVGQTNAGKYTTNETIRSRWPNL
ncbi:hypothetical protein MJO28_012843 [Puccinia striiformis f. sp. tritici]|uniref:Uncharacterized protein n=1 Tax=Puccinia striiformis f. sp. tritici TaxID=168172 RepID=A0ACC0DY26_9BASI|nr:hypothetical protein MJO28_012843 [Puccinia striiformis f. sp. tritici]